MRLMHYETGKKGGEKMLDQDMAEGGVHRPGDRRAMDLDWLSPDATPDMLAAEARECNDRLRAVATSVQNEVLTLAAMICNKPSLHAANLEFELSSQLATSADAGSSPVRDAGTEAAARVQAERHYQAALSHIERGIESLGPACRALRDARIALAPHDSLSATPMSPSSLEPALPGVMSGDDGAVSLVSISQLEARAVKVISDELQRCMTACGDCGMKGLSGEGGRVRAGGIENVCKAVEQLSIILSREQIVVVLGNCLNKSLQAVLAHESEQPVPLRTRPAEQARARIHKLDTCQRIVVAASTSVPAALASVISQMEWERAHHDIFVPAARMVVSLGIGSCADGAGKKHGSPAHLGKMLNWSHQFVLSLHFSSAQQDRLLRVRGLYLAVWTAAAPRHMNGCMVALDGGGERCNFRLLENLEEIVSESLGPRQDRKSAEQTLGACAVAGDDFTPHQIAPEIGCAGAPAAAGGPREASRATEVGSAHEMHQKEVPDAAGDADESAAEWEGAARSCHDVAGCVLSLLPLQGLEPVPGYNDALARSVRAVVTAYLSRVESSLTQALDAGGVQVLYTVGCSLLLLYRVCVKVQKSLSSSSSAGAAVGEGTAVGGSGSGAESSEAQAQMDGCLGALLAATARVTARAVSEHSENCRGCFIVSIAASPWSRRRWFLKRPSPTASHGLLLLNLYMAGLARDVLLGSSLAADMRQGGDAGGAVRGARLPWGMACQVLGGVWEEVSAGLVAAYSRLSPSRANLHQYRIDVNYACQVFGEWTRGVVVGAHTVALSKHHQAFLQNAASALRSWCLLKASPLPRVLSLLEHVESQAQTVSGQDVLTGPQEPDSMVLATPVASPSAALSAPGGEHRSSGPARDAAFARARVQEPQQHMNVLTTLHRLGSEDGPPANFSDAEPAAADLDLRMLDVSLPEVAGLVSDALRRRPEFEKAPFPPLEEEEAVAAQALRKWLRARCPGWEPATS